MTYHEIAIEGPTGRTLGFVQGFLHGRGEGGRILDAYEEGFDCESLRERIREFLRPSMQTYHLLVPADLVPLVEEAVADGAARGMEIAVRENRPIQGARFTFSTQIYSREHAAKIRALFEPAPPGVSCADVSFQEITHPEAKGPESYAPLHDYELKGEGTVRGELLAVRDLHRTARQEELISAGALEIVVD